MRALAPLLVFALLSAIVVSPAASGTRLTDVTVEQARELIRQHAKQADFVILDVRTPAEFADGHVAGAVNLDIADPGFEARLAALDRNKSYLVYCRTGNRSLHAVRAMQRLGFRMVYHMNQGIVAWQKMKLPLSRAS